MGLYGRADAQVAPRWHLCRPPAHDVGRVRRMPTWFLEAGQCPSTSWPYPTQESSITHGDLLSAITMSNVRRELPRWEYR
jgi:hypothetical protein